MVEATCPKCNAKFELGDEFVGATVQCGACGTPFKVGQTGGGETDIEIVCPGCKTVHQVPGNGRGSEAECMICGLTFKIPTEGNLGIAAGPLNKAPRPAAPPPPSAASGIDKNTSTIRLSRSSLSNTMQSKPKAAPGPVTKSATGQLPPKSATGQLPPAAKPPAPAPAAKPAEPAPAAKPHTAALGPIPNLGVKLETDESPVAGQEYATPFPALAIFLTLAPVVLVPLIALWYATSNSTVALVVGTVAALAAWGVAAYHGFSNWQKRSGLLITTKRAVMVVQDQVAAAVPLDR